MCLYVILRYGISFSLRFKLRHCSGLNTYKLLHCHLNSFQILWEFVFKSELVYVHFNSRYKYRVVHPIIFSDFAVTYFIFISDSAIFKQYSSKFVRNSNGYSFAGHQCTKLAELCY